MRRIEAKRATLLASDQAFELVDLGAGAGHEFDGEEHAVRTVDRTVGTMAGYSKPQRWAELLFRLARELRPRTLLEMGSCVGVSAAYQAAAIHLNGDGGRLISLEGSDFLADCSAATLDELGLSMVASVRAGEFSATLPDAIRDLAPIDWVFIDGNHLEAATIAYADALLPHLSSEALLIFDDINWSDGMRRAWRQIVADERIALTVDLRSVGLAVVSSSAEGRRSITVPYW